MARSSKSVGSHDAARNSQYSRSSSKSKSKSSKSGVDGGLTAAASRSRSRQAAQSKASSSKSVGSHDAASRSRSAPVSSNRRSNSVTPAFGGPNESDSSSNASQPATSPQARSRPQARSQAQLQARHQTRQQHNSGENSSNSQSSNRVDPALARAALEARKEAVAKVERGRFQRKQHANLLNQQLRSRNTEGDVTRLAAEEYVTSKGPRFGSSVPQTSAIDQSIRRGNPNYELSPFSQKWDAIPTTRMNEQHPRRTPMGDTEFHKYMMDNQRKFGFGNGGENTLDGAKIRFKKAQYNRRIVEDRKQAKIAREYGPSLPNRLIAQRAMKDFNQKVKAAGSRVIEAYQDGAKTARPSGNPYGVSSKDKDLHRSNNFRFDNPAGWIAQPVNELITYPAAHIADEFSHDVRQGFFGGASALGQVAEEVGLGHAGSIEESIRGMAPLLPGPAGRVFGLLNSNIRR